LLISVIIPAYNRAKTLRRSVVSVINQSRPVLEILIVDDASSDNTVDVARELIKQFPIVKLIELVENSGAQNARNIGVQKSSGEWVAFLDSDDVWKPIKIEMQIDLVNRDPALIGVFTGFEFHRSDENIKISKSLTCVHESDLYSENILGSTSSALIKKNKLIECGGFLLGMPSCQDWELWLRLNRLGALQVVNQPLVEIHYDADGRISGNKEKVIEGHNLIFDKINSEYANDADRFKSKQFLRLSEVLIVTFQDRQGALKLIIKSLMYHDHDYKKLLVVVLKLLKSFFIKY